MHRQRMFEMARDKVKYLQRQRENYLEEIPELEARLAEVGAFLQPFKGDRAVEAKAFSLLCEWGSVPVDLENRIQMRKNTLQQLAQDEAEWSFILAQLKEMWPDIAECEEE